MNVLDEVKKHPYAVGAGVFVIGLLALYYYSGSSSGAQTVQVGPSPANLAAEVQLAQLGASAQAASDSTNAQLQALASNNAKQFAIAQLSAGVEVAALQNKLDINQQNVAGATTSAADQLQAALAGIAAQVQESTHTSDTQLAAILAQVGQNEFTTQQQDALQTTIANNQYQLGTAQVEANRTVAQGNTAAQVQLGTAQIAATQTLAAGNIAAQEYLAALNEHLGEQQVAANVTIAGTNADVAKTQINANLQTVYYNDLLSYFNTQTVANAQTKIAKTQSSTSLGSSLIGGVTGLLGTIL